MYLPYRAGILSLFVPTLSVMPIYRTISTQSTMTTQSSIYVYPVYSQLCLYLVSYSLLSGMPIHTYTSDLYIVCFCNLVCYSLLCLPNLLCLPSLLCLLSLLCMPTQSSTCMHRIYICLLILVSYVYPVYYAYLVCYACMPIQLVQLLQPSFLCPILCPTMPT